MAILDNFFEDKKYKHVIKILEVIVNEEVDDDVEKTIDSTTGAKIICRILKSYSHPQANNEAENIIKHVKPKGEAFSNANEFVNSMKSNIKFKLQIDSVH